MMLSIRNNLFLFIMALIASASVSVFCFYLKRDLAIFSIVLFLLLFLLLFRCFRCLLIMNWPMENAHVRSIDENADYLIDSRGDLIAPSCFELEIEYLANGVTYVKPLSLKKRPNDNVIIFFDPVNPSCFVLKNERINIGTFVLIGLLMFNLALIFY